MIAAATLALGLQELHWSTTRQEALRLFPALRALAVDAPDRIDRNDAFQEFGQHHFMVDGCDFTLNLQFHDDALNIVSLHAIHNVRICKAQIEVDLVARYGKATPSYDRVLHERMIDWRTSNMSVGYGMSWGFLTRYPEPHMDIAFIRKNGYFIPVP